MADDKHTIDFRIVTPEGVTYESEIRQVTLPTEAGEITVLANHTPLVSILKPGELVIKKEDDQGKHEIALAISSGVIEVRPHSEVVILSDTAERAENIDLERAEQARQRAEKMIAEKNFENDIEYARVQALLDRNLARIKVAKRRRL